MPLSSETESSNCGVLTRKKQKEGLTLKAKWLELTWFQRIMLLLQLFLILLFLILYATLGMQQVIRYNGALLRCRTQGDATTYSGKLNGQKVVFTVSPGPVVEFRAGETLYGPYTILEDPTAVPQEHERAEHLHGVEVRKGDQLLFRGAYSHLGILPILYSENGSVFYSGVKVHYSDDLKPNAADILRVALEPDPARRGNWYLWWLGVFVCVACAVLILYADKLFRWNLRFIIRDPEDAEPSDWALFSRWVGWIVLTIFALVLFIMGLNAP